MKNIQSFLRVFYEPTFSGQFLVYNTKKYTIQSIADYISLSAGNTADTNYYLDGISYDDQTGIVTFSKTGTPIADVSIYDKTSGLLTTTNSSGEFAFETSKETLILVFFSSEYDN